MLHMFFVLRVPLESAMTKMALNTISRIELVGDKINPQGLKDQDLVILELLRDTANLTEDLLLGLIHERLMTVGIDNGKWLLCNQIKNTRSPEALAYAILNGFEQRDHFKCLILEKLAPDDTYEMFINRGKGLREKTYEQLMSLVETAKQNMAKAWLSSAQND